MSSISWGSLSFGCFMSGVVGTTGVGGSIFLSSALLLLNLPPLFVKGSITFILFMGTAMSTFLFYFSGFSDPWNSLTFGLLCLVGSIIGNQLINYIQNKRGKASNGSVIAILMLIVMMMTLGMMPLTTYIEISTNNSVFEFGEIC